MSMIRRMVFPLLLLLTCTAVRAEGLAPAPTAIGEAVVAAPPPPALFYTVGGELVAVFSGGRLADAQGLRPLWPWPVLCEVSPCRPQLEPGAAVAVVAVDGSASAVVLVPPRGYRLALPLALRG